MVDDLLRTMAHFERVRIHDDEVYYLPHIDLGRPADAIMRELIACVPWRAENVMVWGKKYAQPRLIAWYGDAGRTYTYSGIQLQPLAWTAVLLDLKARVERAVNAGFNSALLNYYRDNRDSMGFHSDDEPELGPRPLIASLSLGEERVFVLKHKHDRLVKPVRLKLESGSLLVMKAETQLNWKHGIPKETRRCGPRVNLTFRKILVPPRRDRVLPSP
jgi:alkylated DNA repair dioxygenase AlkB